MKQYVSLGVFLSSMLFIPLVSYNDEILDDDDVGTSFVFSYLVITIIKLLFQHKSSSAIGSNWRNAFSYSSWCIFFRDRQNRCCSFSGSIRRGCHPGKFCHAVIVGVMNSVFRYRFPMYGEW